MLDDIFVTFRIDLWIVLSTDGRSALNFKLNAFAVFLKHLKFLEN